MKKEVESLQIWKHRNGNLYIVECITNIPDEIRYPKTVVYRNINNNTLWSREYSDWHRSFTYQYDFDKENEFSTEPYEDTFPI